MGFETAGTISNINNRGISGILFMHIYLGVSGIIQTNIRNGIGSTDPANDNLDQSSQNPRM